MAFKLPIDPVEPLTRVLANAASFDEEQGYLHAQLRDAALQAHYMANQMDTRGADWALRPAWVKAGFTAALGTLRQAYRSEIERARTAEERTSEAIDETRQRQTADAGSSSEEPVGRFDPIDWAGKLREQQDTLEAIQGTRETYEGLLGVVEEVDSLVSARKYDDALTRLAAIRDWHSERAEPRPSPKPLTEDQQLLLRAVQDLRGTVSEDRVTAAEIVEQAKGRMAVPNRFKRDLADLVKRGLLMSAKRELGGGYWLTDLGRSQIETVPGDLRR